MYLPDISRLVGEMTDDISNIFCDFYIFKFLSNLINRNDNNLVSYNGNKTSRNFVQYI